ncbi:hypothetical protein [Caulobacter sp. NIBR2454]|uniref:hypothetical protein n=1 Tax=Caulobacter sp. NIBR2454 TaxID=3015996 RepID=UPI0022B72341|nr:hypothetical protein [Caulobacter sp. NIBR2454]
MTDPIDPTRRLPAPRRAFRRAVDARAADGHGHDDPEVETVHVREEVDPAPPRSGFSAFAAQLLGQGGAKRGLRGGPETLDVARSTYLGAEFSGGADRRRKAGRKQTEI